MIDDIGGDEFDLFVVPVWHLVEQDEVWTRGQPLDEMDEHHRANLIPFLRGNVQTIKAQVAPDDPRPAEDWLVDTPLMRRLCELEDGRTFADRKATAARNADHEQATGYQKVRLG